MRFFKTPGARRFKQTYTITVHGTLAQEHLYIAGILDWILDGRKYIGPMVNRTLCCGTRKCITDSESVNKTQHEDYI